MFTDETRRRDFPSLEGITYLNSAAEGIPQPYLSKILFRLRMRGLG